MNTIIVTGNLTRKPELRTVKTKNGTQNVVDIAVADNYYIPGQSEKGTNFFNYTLWGKRAESAVKFLDKGSRVNVVGTLNVRKYTTKDGKEGQSLDIIQVEDFSFLGGNAGTQAGDAKTAETNYDAPAVPDELPF